MIPAEATVDVTWQDQTWQAVLAGSEQDEFGNTEFELVAPTRAGLRGRLRHPAR